MDAAAGLAKEDGLPDFGFLADDVFAPVIWTGSPLWDVEGVHDILRSWRAIADRYEGDRVLVESALRNLIDNAIKYTPPDGQIDVALVRDGNSARISVSDTGRGIQDASAQGLAERFRRGGNVDDVVGSGLGLTIVSEIAALHHGAFDLKNRKEGGACATFSLPLR